MSTEWLLFLPQVPSSPSSLRVAIWRRMRDAGAVGLGNGVWVLPRNSDQEQFLRNLSADVVKQGGNCFVLAASPIDSGDDIIDRFRLERDREYSEFCERCGGFLAELNKETANEKFTFAELEEADEDYKKLTGWLRKIQARDFFPTSRVHEAETIFAQCGKAHREFAHSVYSREDVGLPAEMNEGDEQE